MRTRASFHVCALLLMVENRCLADTLGDRPIVKVGMFAEIGKNKLDFCLKSNQHAASFKLQRQVNAIGLPKAPTSSPCVPAAFLLHQQNGHFLLIWQKEAVGPWFGISQSLFFIFFPIIYHHYHIKWAISCCQGNFSAEFSSCKHNFPKISSGLIRSIPNGLSLPF